MTPVVERARVSGPRRVLACGRNGTDLPDGGSTIGGDMSPSGRENRSLARSLCLGAALAAGAVGLAACSSSTTAPTTSAPTPVTAGSTTSTASSTTAPTTVPPPAVQNLPVTDAVRAQLVAARAAQVGVPPSTYTGLAPGTTYYAFDHATGTYWAGAATALPATNAPVGSDLYKAQVAGQDDGSYLLFAMPSGGAWTVSPVGLSGTTSPCTVPVPPAVVQVWDWPHGACRPPGT